MNLGTAARFEVALTIPPITPPNCPPGMPPGTPPTTPPVESQPADVTALGDTTGWLEYKNNRLDVALVGVDDTSRTG